nr:putative ribonuclease H-like domain-containing protein [Tanacetum cinerariifolium]
MEFLSPHVVAAAKFPILNPNEFDLWKMIIEQYFLMTDYSLWEVILNGDSPTPTKIIDGIVQVIAPTTAEQRLSKKKELKARGTLLMALLDKHQLKFNIHKDAKSLMEAIEKRFRGNKETKKVQKTLLKQEYENFSGTSSESLDQIYDMLQKLISQLDILDDLFNNLKIYEAEVKSSSTSIQNTLNIAFVSSNNTDSTNESINDVPNVSAASTKAPVSTLPNVDSLSDADIYSFFASQSNSAQTGRNLGANGTAAIGFDMSKVECYNCHRRGYFSSECRSPRDNRNKDTPRRTVPVEVSTSNALVSQCDGVGSYDWSFQTDEDPTNYALMAFTSSGSSNSSGFDNEVAPCSKACSKAYATLQSHYDKLIVDLKSQFDILSYKTESQTIDKTSLGYDRQVFNRQVFNFDELNSSESDDNVPPSPVHDRYKSGEGYHAVPPLYTGTFMPSKPDLVFNDAPKAIEIVTNVVNVESNEPSFVQTSKPVKTPRASVKTVEHPKQAKNLKTDNQKSRGLVSLYTARPVSTVVPHTTMKRPRPVKHVVNKANSPIRIPINHRPAPKNSHFHQKATTFKIKKIQVSHGLGPQKTISLLFDVQGNPQQALKDKGGKITGKGKIKTGKLYFDDVYFVKELKFNLFSVSQMCDKKNSVLFTFTERVVLSSDFKLPDENHVLLRVPRKNNMYSVDLKHVVPSGDLTCLFAKATLDESNLWHRKLGHINFKTMNKLVKGNFVRGLPSKVFENNHTCVACKKGKQHRAFNQPNHNAGIKENLDADKVRKKTKFAKQYVLLPLWSTGSQDPQNTDVDDAFDVQENKNKVYVSPSSSDKPKKHDEKAKREAKGKSHVDLSTRVRDLSDEFEEFSVNSTNRVNVARAPVTAVGPNPTNSTNSFNAASPFDNVVHPTFEIGGKSSFVDPS